MGRIWIPVAAVAALLLVELALLWPLDPSFMRLQLAFTPRAFGQVVHAWGDAGLRTYRDHLPLDWVLLACYAGIGPYIVARAGCLATVSAGWRRAAFWLLPLAATFDAGENLLHAWLTELPRLGVTLPYLLAGTCSMLKFGLIGAFVALLAWARVRRAMR